MTSLIDRLRLGDGTSPDHLLLLEAANALESERREWVGLTDEEIIDMMGYKFAYIPKYTRNFVEAIEAQLKDKNT
jgi:hypothetical protein